MPWDEHRLVSHGPQPLRDAVDQILVVAHREIRAADAARKQHVAHKGPVDLRRMEHHMPRRVPGAVAHGQRLVANLHRVAIRQPARGREMLRRRKTKHRALLRQPVNPELIARVWTHDGQPQTRGQFARAPRMVDVCVREPDLRQREAQALHLGQQHLQVAPWVDHSGLLRGIAPDEGAVLLKRGNWDGEVAEHAGCGCC